MFFENTHIKIVVLLHIVVLIFSCHKRDQYYDFDASQAFIYELKWVAQLEVSENSLEYGDYVNIQSIDSDDLYFSYQNSVTKYTFYTDLVEFVHLGELSKPATMTIFFREDADSTYHYENQQPYGIKIVDDDYINSVLDTNNWYPLDIISIDSTKGDPDEWGYSLYEYDVSFEITDLNSLYCLAKEY